MVISRKDMFVPQYCVFLEPFHAQLHQMTSCQILITSLHAFSVLKEVDAFEVKSFCEYILVSQFCLSVHLIAACLFTP